MIILGVSTRSQLRRTRYARCRFKSVDKLADRVVAQGVGEYDHKISYSIQHPVHKHWSTHISAHDFVRDPRVAMALMERCVVEELQIHLCNVRANTRCCNIDRFAPDESVQVDDFVPVSNAQSESDLPRAITEACVCALESEA